MTLAEVIALINSDIVPNGNNEITANVLRPILIEMLQQPNDLIGELDELNTVENDTLVKAINSVNNALSDVEGLVILSGQGDPNQQSFPTLSIADLYSEIDGLGSPLALWIYDGTKFIRLSDKYLSYEIPQDLTPTEQLIARSNINATDRRLEELVSDLTEEERDRIKQKISAVSIDDTQASDVTTYSSDLIDQKLNLKLDAEDLNGLLENPTYDSDTHIFTMDVVDGGTFSIDFPIEALITNVELDDDNNLVITFEDGSEVLVPLNTLLVGVVKSVNGKTPNSQGQVVINITDIAGLNSELNKIGALTTLTTTDKSNLVNAINEVNDSMPNVNDFGGVNLVDDSHFYNGNINGWSGLYGTQVVENHILKKTFTDLLGSSRIERVFQSLKAGVYTLTIFVKTPQNIEWRGFINGTSLTDESPSNPNEFTRRSVTFTVPTDSDVTVRGYVPNIPVGSVIEIDWFKLETGYVGSDWTPTIEEQKSDWDETNLLKPSYIKNKPEITTVNDGELSLSTGSGLSGSATFTANQVGDSTFSVSLSPATLSSLSLADTALQDSDLNGYVSDVQYNSSTNTITFYRHQEPNVVVDLPAEQLISGVELVGNDLIFTFEDDSTVTVPLNTLLVGVVKSVNGKTPNSQGEVVINAEDITGLPTNYITTDTDQTGLTGNKSVDGTWTFNSQINTSNHGNSSQWNTAFDWGDFRDYGLAIPVNMSYGQDLSSLDFTGFARTTFGTDFPSGVAGNSFVINNYINEDRGHQIVYEIGSDRVFFRRNFNGFTPWVEFIHTGNLNSQATSLGFIKSSALPTVNNGQLTLSTSPDLTGGGTFSANQATASNVEIGLSSSILDSIANGQTAYSWGNHALAGYLTSTDLDDKANTDGSNTTGGTWKIDSLSFDNSGNYINTGTFESGDANIPETDALEDGNGVVIGSPIVSVSIAENSNGGAGWDGYLYRFGAPKAGYPAEVQTGNYLIESKHRFRVHSHDSLDDLVGSVGKVILNPYNAIEHQYFEVNIFETMDSLEIDIQNPEQDELTGHEIRRNFYGQRISVNVKTNAYTTTFTGVKGVSFTNGGKPGVYKYVWDGVWMFDGYSPNEF